MKKDIVHSTILITTFIIFTIGIYQLYVTIPNIPNECEIPRMYAPEYVKLSVNLIKINKKGKQQTRILILTDKLTICHSSLF